MSAKLTPEDLQAAMERHQREREEAAIAERASPARGTASPRRDAHRRAV